MQYITSDVIAAQAFAHVYGGGSSSEVIQYNEGDVIAAKEVAPFNGGTSSEVKQYIAHHVIASPAFTHVDGDPRSRGGRRQERGGQKRGAHHPEVLYAHRRSGRLIQLLWISKTNLS